MKKIKKNKKIIIIIALIIIVILLAIIFICKKVKINSYDKYSMSISLITVKDGDEKNNSINASFDGNNLKIEKGYTNSSIYKIDDEIIYKGEDNQVYYFKTDYSYNNIYKELTKYNTIKKEIEGGDITSYTVTYDKDVINEILKNLYIDKEVSSSQTGKISISDNKIIFADISIKGIDNYDEIGIILNFGSLSSDYTVDTSYITDLLSPKTVYSDSNSISISAPLEKQETNENILKIIE